MVHGNDGPEMIHDIELKYWNRLRKGDPSGLSWIYDHYFNLLYNYGRKIRTGNKSLEDAIHDLFVDLWRFRENLSPTTSVKFYLYRSLRRRLVRNGNSEAIFLMDEDSMPDKFLQSVPCLEQDIIEGEVHRQRVRQLKKLLNDLSPRQYEAMILRFYDDLSFEEIGSILNVNEQSARNLVQRGLSQLRQYSKLLLGLVALLMTTLY